MGKLNDTKLRAIKPTDKAAKYTDGDGLYLYVLPSGGKSWRIDYAFEGKRKTFTLGLYPTLTLAQARRELADFKIKLHNGIDPAAEKKAIKESHKAEEVNTFEIIAREWHSKNMNKWKESHAKKILGLFTKNIFPFLGRYNIANITPPQLLETIQRVEARGYNETAHRTLQACGQVFRYAIVTGRAERDISADLKGALESIKSKHYPTLCSTSS